MGAKRICELLDHRIYRTHGDDDQEVNNAQRLGCATKPQRVTKHFYKVRVPVASSSSDNEKKHM